VPRSKLALYTLPTTQASGPVDGVDPLVRGATRTCVPGTPGYPLLHVSTPLMSNCAMNSASVALGSRPSPKSGVNEYAPTRTTALLNRAAWVAKRLAAGGDRHLGRGTRGGIRPAAASSVTDARKNIVRSRRDAPRPRASHHDALCLRDPRAGAAEGEPRVMSEKQHASGGEAPIRRRRSPPRRLARSALPPRHRRQPPHIGGSLQRLLVTAPQTPWYARRPHDPPSCRAVASRFRRRLCRR
jgi:hypothetical protein